jgi:hypothetical protein
VDDDNGNDQGGNYYEQGEGEYEDQNEKEEENDGETDPNQLSVLSEPTSRFSPRRISQLLHRRRCAASSRYLSSFHPPSPLSSGRSGSHRPRTQTTRRTHRISALRMKLERPTSGRSPSRVSPSTHMARDGRPRLSLSRSDPPRRHSNLAKDDRRPRTPYLPDVGKPANEEGERSCSTSNKHP